MSDINFTTILDDKQFSSAINGMNSKIGKLGNKLDDVSSGGSRFSNVLGKISSTSVNLGNKLSILSASVVAVGAGLFALGNNAAKALDEIGNMSAAAGVSAEYFQEMDYALNQVAEISSDQLASSLTKATKTIGEAATGSKKAAESLMSLGFTQDQINAGTITTEEVMSKYIDTVTQMDNQQQAAALGTDLFGKSFAGIGSALSGTGTEMDLAIQRSRDLGIVLSNETVAAGQAFTDKMSDVTSVLTSMQTKLGAELLPEMTKFADWMTTDGVAAFDTFVAGIRSVIDWYSSLSNSSKAVLETVGLVFGVGGPIILAIRAFIAAINLMFLSNPFTAIAVLIAVAAVAIYQNWDEIVAYFDAVDQWFVDLEGRLYDGALSAFTAIGDGIKAAYDATIGPYVAMVQTALDSISWNTIKGPGAMMGSGGKGQIIPNVDAGTSSGIEGYSTGHTYGEQIETGAKDALDINSPSKVFQSIGNFISQGLGLGIKESSTVVQDALAQAVATTDTNPLASWTEGLQVGLDDVGSLMKSTFSDAENIFVEFTKTGKASFDSLISNMADGLARLAFQQGASVLMGSGTGFGSFLGTLLGAASGTPIPANATGTNYFKGGLTSINERGGELINLPRGSQIIPHDISKQIARGRTSTGNSSMINNITINNAQPYSQDNSAQLAAQLNEVLDRKLQKFQIDQRNTYGRNR